MENRKPKINYIILAIILVVVLFACIYILRLYKIHKENDLSIAILSEYLGEIKIDELNDYLIDNPYVFIYTCFSDDENCRKVELDFKNTIVDYSLREHILYLNLKSIKDKYPSDYMSKIKEYFPGINVENIPAILVYTDRQLSQISYITSGDDVLKLLDMYEVNYHND